MLVIPAVDLKDGQCVRLFQGDYRQVTVYEADPAAAALRWQRAGARLLHVVDLDGAAAGAPQNLAAIRAIVRAVTIPIELGGGVRDVATLGEMLSLGVSRVVLGTAAVEDPALVREACRKWGVRVVVGIDARDGMVATRGWLATTAVAALDLAAQMVELGVKRLAYTDITRDGTLTQPNYVEVAKLARSVGVPVIASGGVASLDHLRRLAALGVEGAIVGRALYTGDVDLAAAVAAVQNVEPAGDAH